MEAAPWRVSDAPAPGTECILVSLGVRATYGEHVRMVLEMDPDDALDHAFSVLRHDRLLYVEYRWKRVVANEVAVRI